MIASVRFTILLVMLFAAPVAASPHLESDPPVDDSGRALSETGYYQLTWETETDGDSVAIVEQSLTAGFAKPNVIYRGPDHSTTLSGRLDGEYHYRLRIGDGPWSDPLTVVVQHHSLREALAYLSVGAIVFLATGVLVVAGHLAHRREEQQS